MYDVFGCQNVAVCLQVGKDGLMGLEDADALVLSGVGGEAASGVHVDHHGGAGVDLIVFFADVKVVHAVGGSRMYAARTGVQGHVVAVDDKASALRIQGVNGLH